MNGGMNSGNAGPLSQPIKRGNASLRGWLGPGDEGGEQHTGPAHGQG